jgi:hypothetical protein
MKYGVFSLFFVAILVSSIGSYAGEKNCYMHLVEKRKTEAEVKAIVDSKCPSVCKEWLCTTGGHGSYTGTYSKEEDWRTKEVWKVMCRCEYKY